MVNRWTNALLTGAIALFGVSSLILGANLYLSDLSVIASLYFFGGVGFGLIAVSVLVLRDVLTETVNALVIVGISSYVVGALRLGAGGFFGELAAGFLSTDWVPHRYGVHFFVASLTSFVGLVVVAQLAARREKRRAQGIVS